MIFQLAVDHLVVSVDPLDLFSGEQLPYNWFGVDGTKSDGLEIIKCAKLLCFFLFLCHDQVLNTNTILVGTIETRFVRGDHPRFQQCGVFFKTDTLWTFMNIQKVTNTMTCAMPVGEVVLPQCFSCQDIELCTTCTFGINYCRQ